MEIELEGKNLRKTFRGIIAVDDVSFHLRRGEVLGFVGANGAGKTTIINLITGFLPLDRGQIFHQSQDITNVKPHQLLSLGICRSWQNVRLHLQLSVLDNVTLGMPHPAGENPVMTVFRSGFCKREEALNREKAMSYLEFVGLADRANELAGRLVYPEQKLVALARLMATEVSTWLLDEPMSGLDQVLIIKTMIPLMQKMVSEWRKNVIVIEHNLDVIRGLCERAYFLEQGKVLVEGPPEELMRDPYLKKSYFSL